MTIYIIEGESGSGVSYFTWIEKTAYTSLKECRKAIKELERPVSVTEIKAKYPDNVVEALDSDIAHESHCLDEYYKLSLEDRSAYDELMMELQDNKYEPKIYRYKLLELV